MLPAVSLTKGGTAELVPASALVPAGGPLVFAGAGGTVTVGNGLPVLGVTVTPAAAALWTSVAVCVIGGIVAVAGVLTGGVGLPESFLV